MLATEGFSHDQLNDQGDGWFTVTVGARPDLKRDGVTPSQPGDVLSVQDDGNLQTRAAGTSGSFELCRKTRSGNGVVFRPFGKRTIFFPLD